MSRRRAANRVKPLRISRRTRTLWSPWSASIQGRAAALFDVQMWLWGRDVLRPEGNLLITQGLTRVPPSDLQRGRTFYRLKSQGESVSLWGWGMFYGIEGLGGLFLNRHRFQLLWTDQAVLSTEVSKFEDLRDFCSPNSYSQRTACHSLLRKGLRWIAEYERSVAATTRTGYRRDCLASRSDWPAVSKRIAAELADDESVDATAAAWERLLPGLDTAMRSNLGVLQTEEVR